MNDNFQQKLIFAIFLVLILGISIFGYLARFKPASNVHIYYKLGYNNPDTDGIWRQWNHYILDETLMPQSFPGGNDIGSNYFPQLGSYSSNNPVVILNHMKQIRKSGVGVVNVSWEGEHSIVDQSVPLLMDAAADVGLKVNFHIESFTGFNSTTLIHSIDYLVGRYQHHSAFDRSMGKPVIYIKDPFQIDIENWLALYQNHADLLDQMLLFGQMKEFSDSLFFNALPFDGVYTFEVSDGFTELSDPHNWQTLSKWANKHRMLFIPSVGPGYSDTRIKPWNYLSTKSRKQGDYYSRYFAWAIQSKADIILINSFNDWATGTQIEPAIPIKIEDYEYENYLPQLPHYYIDQTLIWSRVFNHHKKMKIAEYLD